MIIDYHLHSRYSSDGEMTIESACKKAIEIGLDEIAFTDHIDIDWPDPDFAFDIPNLDEYIAEIEENKKRFKGLLKIKTGIEMGLQPHILENAADIIHNYPFDFVIGSVHIIQRMDPYQGNYFHGKTKEESYRLYYEETLKLINDFNDFDVLGHIGYIKRYSPLPYEQDDVLLNFDLIEEILKTLIKNGKGIEVNTSGYRHISKCPMPPFEIIKKYKDLGGTIITIGSDAHSIEGIGFGLESGLAEIKQAGFNSITRFTLRKPEFFPIV